MRQEPGGVIARLTRPVKVLIIGAVGLIVIAGVSILTIGIFLGAMVVLGMWLTIERIGWIRPFARTPTGMLILSIGAALLVHMVIGTSTATGAIAAATALVLKYFLLQAEAGQVLTSSNAMTGAKVIEGTLAY